jgi:hypothetical protein
LLLTVALGAASSADWLREAKYGAFMHLLPSDAKTLAMVDDFDVERLTGQLESIGAKYFVLTPGQNSGYFNATCRVRRRTRIGARAEGFRPCAGEEGPADRSRLRATVGGGDPGVGGPLRRPRLGLVVRRRLRLCGRIAMACADVSLESVGAA